MSIVFAADAQYDSGKKEIPEIRTAFAPAYPEGAWAAQAEGIVTVRLKILNDGSVSSANFLTGNKMFSRTVENAARKWTFVPAVRHRNRETVITFVFELLPESKSSEKEGVIFTKPGSVNIRKRVPTAQQVISNG
jgi:TonB family protein